ncbi:MAG: hypothetical protein ACK56I_28485 [bacterium]
MGRHTATSARTRRSAQGCPPSWPRMRSSAWPMKRSPGRDSTDTSAAGGQGHADKPSAPSSTSASATPAACATCATTATRTSGASSAAPACAPTAQSRAQLSASDPRRCRASRRRPGPPCSTARRSAARRSS